MPYPPDQWEIKENVVPPSWDFHWLTPPVIISSSFVGEAASAKSYQPWPPSSVPSSQPNILFVAVDDILVENELALFIDLNKPKNPLSVELAASTYTYSGFAGVTAIANLLTPVKPVFIVTQLRPPSVDFLKTVLAA